MARDIFNPTPDSAKRTRRELLLELGDLNLIKEVEEVTKESDPIVFIAMKKDKVLKIQIAITYPKRRGTVS